MAIQLEMRIRSVMLAAVGVFAVLLILYIGDILLDHVMVEGKLQLELHKAYHLMFDFNLEANPPTHYSALLLLINTMLLLLIASAERQSSGEFVQKWRALAFLFFLLAFDESATLHEKIPYPVHIFLESIGVPPRLFWVVLGIIVVIIGFLFFRRFLWHLPRRTLLLLILSGVLYTMGIIVVDMFSAWFILPQTDRSETIYRLMVGIEEIFEFMGILAFLYTHLHILSKGSPVLAISISFSSLKRKSM